MIDDDEQQWAIWNIGNPWLRLFAAWLVVIFIVPIVVVTYGVIGLLVAVVRDQYRDTPDNINGYLKDMRTFFTRDTWIDIWRTLTSLDRVK